MKAFLSGTIVLLVCLVPLASAGDSEVVTKWLASQSKVKSLTADFTQQRVLREGKRPIVSKGKFAFVAPGSFRWQMGDPAVTLAVQKRGGDLVVSNEKRKRATIYSAETLQEEEAAKGFSFIEAGFPKNLAEFEKNFTVTDEELKDGLYHVTVKINDRRTSVGLRKMIFYIAPGSYDLRGFYLRFRDSGSISTMFKNVKKNPSVSGSEFEVNLAGYKTETK